MAVSEGRVLGFSLEGFFEVSAVFLESIGGLADAGDLTGSALRTSSVGLGAGAFWALAASDLSRATKRSMVLANSVGLS